MLNDTSFDAGAGRSLAGHAPSLPIVLIAHRDLRVRRRAARTMSPVAIVRPAPHALVVEDVLRQYRVAGVVLELEMPGVDLDALLDHNLVVIAAQADARTASRLSGRGVELVAADESPAELARRLRGFGGRLRQRVDQRQASAIDLAQQYRLTPAETELLVRFVGGTARGELADRLGIAETSVRSRVRGVCRKLGVPHLEHCYRLLFEANLEGVA